MKLFRPFAIFQILVNMFFKMVLFNLQRFFLSQKKRNQRLDRHVLTWAAFVLRKIRLTLEVKNRGILNQVNWQRNIFLVANHQSYSDIPTLFLAAQRHFGFIAKYELRFIPFLHFWMKTLGCVFIKRTQYVAAIKALQMLEKNGHSTHLTIFPEGTRSKTGALAPFKTGGLKFAWQLDAILLPVVIQGTRSAWEDRSAKLPLTASVHFFSIIDLAEIKKKKDFKTFIKEFEAQFRQLHPSQA